MLFLGLLCAAVASVASSARQSQTPDPAVKSTSSQPRACGTFSDYLIEPDVGLPIKSPDAALMPSRLYDLKNTTLGYERTGRSMVAVEGRRLVPSAISDDPGLYEFIPWVARNFGLPLTRVLAIFFPAVLIFALVSGCVGFLLVLKTGWGRAVALSGAGVLAILAYRTGDVYLLEFAAPVGLLPWIVGFGQSFGSNFRRFAIFLFAAGCIAGAAGLIRSSAGTPTLVFTLVLIFLTARPFKTRTALASLVLAGFLCPQLYSRYLLSKRDIFLATHVSDGRQDFRRHVLGHLAYIGTGFLSNPYVPGGICDEMAKDKVRSIDPSAAYLSKEYDTILRRETLKVVLHHPTLALFTLAAKAGIIVFVLVVFSNVGLLCAIRYPKSRAVEIAFWTAITVAALPLLIAAPLPLYLVGLMSLSVIYGIFSFDHALGCRRHIREHSYTDKGAFHDIEITARKSTVI